MRLHHYSIHTERSYCDWIRRFILYHRMTSRNYLKDGEPKIERFLTHLAVDGHLSPSAQNQAMNALVFFYRKFLGWELDQKIGGFLAKSRQKVPVVMTRDEVARVISLTTGTPKLVSKLLYGSGLRLSEALRLRVHDIDFEMKNITVRSGKSDKDRVTTFPASVIPILPFSRLRGSAANSDNTARTVSNKTSEVFLV